MDKDCNERCDLLRSYFHRVNPFSLPCTYKSNFETSAVHNLLIFSVHKDEEIQKPTGFKPENDTISNKKEFGPWGVCRHFESGIKVTSAGNRVGNNNTINYYNSQPYVNKVRELGGSRKFMITRPQNTENNLVTRKKSKDPVKKTNNILEDFPCIKYSKNSFHYNFQYHEDYYQFMKDYRDQYTSRKLQSTNSGRQLVSHSRILAYDLRKTVQDLAGLSSNNVDKTISLNPVLMPRKQAEMPTINVHLPGMIEKPMYPSKKETTSHRIKQKKPRGLQYLS